MKIKYRRFDDNDYTEVDGVSDFRYISDSFYGTPLLEFYAKGYQDCESIKNVCEVEIVNYENKISQI